MSSGISLWKVRLHWKICRIALGNHLPIAERQRRAGLVVMEYWGYMATVVVEVGCGTFTIIILEFCHWSSDEMSSSSRAYRNSYWSQTLGKEAADHRSEVLDHVGHASLQWPRNFMALLHMGPSKWLASCSLLNFHPSFRARIDHEAGASAGISSLAGSRLLE